MSRLVRLERETPVRRQAGCATAIGACLSILGGATIYLLRHQVQASPSDWLFYAVGGGFSVVGLTTLVLGLKMLAMARLPETIVEVDRATIVAGTPFHVTVRQPGPLRLRSLRLNLVAEQVTTRTAWRRGRRERNRDRRLIHQHNVLDIGEITIARGAEFTECAETAVPAHVVLADVEGEKVVVWRLEIWGRVRKGVDFGHPFLLNVRGSKATTNGTAAALTRS